MTERERENRFIEKCRQAWGTVTPEAEMLLRHGYSAGASELARVAYTEGVDDQRATVLAALGAAPMKKEHSSP